jgi:hypothetical protein
VQFQQHRTVIKFFFLQGKAPKKIHAILTETLGEHASSYAIVENWVTQVKRGDFSTRFGVELSLTPILVAAN